MSGISIYEALRKVKLYRTEEGGFYLQRLLSDYIFVVERANRWSLINYTVVCLCLWAWAPWYVAASSMFYMGADTIVSRVCSKRLRQQAHALAEELANGRSAPPLASFHPSQWKP